MSRATAAVSRLSEAERVAQLEQYTRTLSRYADANNLTVDDVILRTAYVFTSGQPLRRRLRLLRAVNRAVLLRTPTRL